jgi:hypothetical protein
MLKAIRTSIGFRLTLRLTVATLTGVCLLLVGITEVRDSSVFQWIGVKPAAAQFTIPEGAGQRVYERLPYLPLENQYVSKQTGKVDENNTLVARLMRYHIFVKRRPAIYRLDWKLTLADYLGANDYLVDSQYPSANTSRENPMEGDRKAIEQLTRAQRDALVNVLVSIFNPNNAQAPTEESSTMPSTSPSPTPSSPSASPSLPQPGDSRLLQP